jgi:hypothetical protein
VTSKLIHEDAKPWYIEHSNIATLASWAADHGYEAKEVADMVDKPWKYDDEFQQAVSWAMGADEP